MKHIGICLALSLLLSKDARADGPREPFQKIGPARLFVLAPQENGVFLLRFSDTLEFIIEVDGSMALEVEPPASWCDTPGWKVKDPSTPTVKTLEPSAGRRWRQSFCLDPFSPGAHSVQIASLRYRDGTEEWQTVAWPTIPLRITTQMANGELKNLRERTPIEELPEPPPATRWWLYLAIGGAALAGIVAFAWLVRRRGGSSVMHARTPLQLAQHEIERLRGLGLPEKGEMNKFHTLLANIVRRFLEKEHLLPARRLTTEEFSSLLEAAPRLTLEQKEFLRDFLRCCDLAKFAGATVSPQECVVLLGKVESFLQSGNSV